MENCSEKLKCKKQFFLYLFLVSFVMYIFSYLIIFVGHDFFVNIASKAFFLHPRAYDKFVVTAFMLWKLLIIQFTLVPLITLCILEKVAAKKAE